MEKKPGSFYCDRFEQLRSLRAPYENNWKDVAKFMRPVRHELGALYAGQAVPQNDIYVTSGVAALALDNFVGGIYGYLSNEANAWASLETFDADLNKSHTAKVWLETVSRRVLNSFGPSVSPFYSQIPETYADCPAFGTAGFLSELKRDRRTFHDRAYSPFDLYYDVDDYGEVCGVYRPFNFTKRQIVQKWGEDNLPSKVKALKDGETTCLVHIVEKNDAYTQGMIGPKGFPYTDVYVGLEDKHVFQLDGRYDTYQTPRWSGSGTYGYGLGLRSLPDIKTHNAMERSLLEYAEWQAHPSQLLPDRNMISAIPRPRKPIYGGMSMGGRPMAAFLAPQGNIGVTHEMTAARAEIIRESWFFSLMQMVGRSGMTAVEVMQRDETKMRLIGPHLGRIQREFLSPSFTQRFMILWRAGWLPEPPPELRNQPLNIRYVSPMANAQKSASAQGALRLMDATIALAQVDPEAADTIDSDAAALVFQEGFSAPASMIRAPEKIAQRREGRNQRAAMQDQLAMGQQGADIAQKLAIAVPRNDGRKAA